MDIFDQFIVTTLRSATPIIIAAMAGLFSVRAGIFNMGLEGLMLAGAFTAVATGIVTGSILFSLIAAVVICLALSAAYWLLIEKYRADPVITGLGLTATAAGGAAFLTQVIFGKSGSIQSPVRMPVPVSGATDWPLSMVNQLSLLTWLLPVFVIGTWLILRRSQFGLRISAVGEYPYGAEAAGINIGRTRLYAMLITGAGCALAGAQLAVGDLASFSDNMTNGRGFIALAAILFGAKWPGYTALAGLFFGFAEALGVVIQINADGTVPREFVLMAPFVATIAIVTLSSALTRRKT